MHQRSSRNFKRVWRRDRGWCRYCGDTGAHVDHVVPWTWRPDNSMSNLVLSCARCNQMAGNMMLGTFDEKRAWIRSRRGIMNYDAIDVDLLEWAPIPAIPVDLLEDLPTISVDELRDDPIRVTLAMDLYAASYRHKYGQKSQIG